ncbi:MAG: efflux RND transporter periplasmic adaptor subunit, partial [Pseudanabaena sp.]
VEQGARVSKGQIIARMDNSNLIPQLYQAQANAAALEANLAKLRNGSRPEDIAAAQARVESARGRVEAARSRLALNSMRTSRYRNLQAEGAISRDRLDEVITDDRSTQADVLTAEANLAEANRQFDEVRNGSRGEDIAQAEAQLAQAIAGIRLIEVQIEDTIIRAPFAGIITQKYANAGAFVTPTTTASSTNSSTSTSIVAIANGLEIIAKVPEVDISQIRIGQEVEIVADAFPSEVFKGKVRLIAPEAIIEQNVTSFQVRVTLETGKDKLQSGMNTDLRFIGQKIDKALVVPTVAIVTQEGIPGLLIADEKGKPKFQAVTIGTTVDNQTQILSGAKVGDRVFVKLPETKSKP